jgi:hypothetical protein
MELGDARSILRRTNAGINRAPRPVTVPFGRALDQAVVNETVGAVISAAVNRQ